jgi:urease accessory protein
MLIIENIITETTDAKRLERDTVHLDWEGRQKCRQRLTTQAGQQIGLALPTGTVLTPGDVLYRDEQVEIVVEGVPEKVFVLRPTEREAFGLVCYQLGNLHRPIGFQDSAILVPYEPVLENQLRRLGYAYTIEERVFTHAARRPSQAHSHVH